MATSFGYFILSCFIFLVFQQVVHCDYINCYSCTTCGATVSTWSTVASSSTGYNFCYKYYFNTTATTSRGALSSCTSGPDGLGGTYYCCLLDYCNGSVIVSNSLGLVFALVTGVCVLKRILIN